MSTEYDTNATRGNHYLSELAYRPVDAEVTPDTRGTASHQALSFYELCQRSPEMGEWAWLVGPEGYRPEMGRPYMYRPGPCTSTNKTCHCPACVSPASGHPCICERHKPEESAA